MPNNQKSENNNSSINSSNSSKSSSSSSSSNHASSVNSIPTIKVTEAPLMAAKQNMPPLINRLSPSCRGRMRNRRISSSSELDTDEEWCPKRHSPRRKTPSYKRIHRQRRYSSQSDEGVKPIPQRRAPGTK